MQFCSQMFLCPCPGRAFLHICKTSENVFWDHSKTKQLPTISPIPKLPKLSHAVTIFKGQPNLQLVIHDNCCIKTAQAVCGLILKKASGTVDQGAWRNTSLEESVHYFIYLWRHKLMCCLYSLESMTDCSIRLASSTRCLIHMKEAY